MLIMTIRPFLSVNIRAVATGLVIALVLVQSGCALMKAQAHQAAKKKQPTEYSCGEKLPPSHPL